MADIGPYGELVKKAYESLHADGLQDEEEYRLPITASTAEYWAKRFHRIRSDFGHTPAEIVSKRRHVVDSHEVLEALWAIGCYYHQYGVPNTVVENFCTAYIWFAAEINNGSFHQYFFNSAGNTWPSIVQLLREGNDEDGLGRFLDVLSIFPEGKPAIIRTKRWAQMQAMEAADPQGVEAHFSRHSEIYYDKPYPTDELFWTVIERRVNEIRLPWRPD
jgi:hypothetical protein